MAAKGLAPLVYKLQGQAEGFAAASGANSVQPEHLLLALLWEPHGRHAYLLKTLRVPRARVQRRLAAAGVAVPPRLPPRSDDTRWGEFVTIRLPSSDAWQLAGLITRLLPHGAPFAFNFGGGKRGSLQAQASISHH